MQDLIVYLEDNARPCNVEDGDADVIFFGVQRLPTATAEGLKAAMAAHVGEFCECNPLDGKDHNFIELGGWVGDQRVALILIGLGASLGMWELITPKTLFGDFLPPATVQKMAGMGMVGIGPLPIKAS